MKYFNKEGEEIDFKTYWNHLMDPKYCRVARNVFGTKDVCSWWIGLQTQFDVRPIIFCTFVRKIEADGNPILMSTWFTDSASVDHVLKFHLGQAAEVGIPIGKRAMR